MTPSAPAAAPITSNTNMPYGGFGQAQQDYSTASNILSYLPIQQAQTAQVNPSDTSILPSINPTYSTYNAPKAQTVNAGDFGNNLTGYNQAVQSALQSLTSSEQGTYNQALQDYQRNINQFGNLPQVYQQLATTYGLPGYQQDVNTLQNLLQNLNQDVNARTTLGGGLMTQSARDEIYANEANPLNLALSSASRAYETGQTNVNNLLGAYETGLQNALKPLELNISNLPELFSQTNQAAQSGYEQGATAIQNTISNRIQQEQADAFAREVAAQYGSGANGFLQGQGSFQGMTLKSTTAGGKGGYNFQVGGAPVSAATWATMNGQNPATVIAYMAQSGDQTAGQAYQYLTSNPGASIADLAAKFPSLAWGMAAPTPPPALPKPATPQQIANDNIKSLSPGNSSNFGDFLWQQLIHPSRWL